MPVPQKDPPYLGCCPRLPFVGASLLSRPRLPPPAHSSMGLRLFLFLKTHMMIGRRHSANLLKTRCLTPRALEPKGPPEAQRQLQNRRSRNKKVSLTQVGVLTTPQVEPVSMACSPAGLRGSSRTRHPNSAACEGKGFVATPAQLAQCIDAAITNYTETDPVAYLYRTSWHDFQVELSVHESS